MNRQISFRDPSGSLFESDDKILRVIHRKEESEVFLRSKKIQHWIEQKKIVAAESLSKEEQKKFLRHFPELSENSEILQHRKIFFRSYPYEWCPEALYAAAELTLDLASDLLSENIGVKDATPYNILFEGSHPIFVDMLSFERRNPTDAIWRPYAQFVRTFLLPLAVNKYFHMPLDQIFLTRRDGLEPQEVYEICGPLRRFLPPFLGLTTIPTLFHNRAEANDALYAGPKLDNPEKAKFILQSVLASLRRTLKKFRPRERKSSAWSAYDQTCNYTDAANAAKVDFVQRFLAHYQPQDVLDVGCNTGRFSEIAAAAGARVVAIDSDCDVVGTLWQAAQKRSLDILPLTVNIVRPSPALGWVNEELDSFLSRAQGKFDAVFMLALVHHLMISERIPLPKIFQLAAQITKRFAIIEYVGPGDSMFKKLLRGRDELFSEFSLAEFEEQLAKHFRVIESVAVPGSDRKLFLLEKIHGI